METVREFMVAIPRLCEAQNADRIAEVFGFIFDREMEGGTAFDRNEMDRKDFGNRSALLWDMLWADNGTNEKKITHCQKLMEIIERSHYLDHHGEKDHCSIIDNLYAEISEYEKDPQEAEIAAAMPASVAVTLGGWNI